MQYPTLKNSSQLFIHFSAVRSLGAGYTSAEPPLIKITICEGGQSRRSSTQAYSNPCLNSGSFGNGVPGYIALKWRSNGPLYALLNVKNMRLSYLSHFGYENGNSFHLHCFVCRPLCWDIKAQLWHQRLRCFLLYCASFYYNESGHGHIVLVKDAPKTNNVEKISLSFVIYVWASTRM